MLHDNKCVGECSLSPPLSVLSPFLAGPELFFVVDIDECGTELARCPSNTYCHNTDGSYECRGRLVCVSDGFIVIGRCPFVNSCVRAQVVTRPVWDAWAAVPPVVRNALAATD